MDNTINFMLEGETSIGATTLSLFTESEQVFNNLTQIEESEKSYLNYGPEKVVINQLGENNYLMEYSNNLERYIADAKVYTIEEAIENVAEANGILEEDLTIVVDESCVSKIDLEALSDKYSVVRS